MLTKLWQLKSLQSGIGLNEPQLLPENWGPIFGLENVADRLHDLSWVDLPDLGWFVVGELPPPPPETPREELIRQEALSLLRECDWTMLPDEPLTVGERADWKAYRDKLRRTTKTQAFPPSFKMPDRPNEPLSHPL